MVFYRGGGGLNLVLQGVGGGIVEGASPTGEGSSNSRGCLVGSKQFADKVHLPP